MNLLNLWTYVKMVKAYNIWEDERGLGVVEIAMIIVVMIALTLIFRDQAKLLIEAIFKAVKIENLNGSIS